MDTEINLNLPEVLLDVLASIGSKNSLDCWRVYANKDCTNVVLKFKPLEDQPLQSPPQQGFGIKHRSASKKARDLQRAEQNRSSFLDSGYTSTPFISTREPCPEDNSASQDNVHDNNDVCSQGAPCSTITNIGISSEAQPSEKKDLTGETAGDNSLTLCSDSARHSQQTKQKSKSDSKHGKSADPFSGAAFNFAGQFENSGSRKYDGYKEGYRGHSMHGADASSASNGWIK